jgi:hypothetical protein
MDGEEALNARLAGRRDNEDDPEAPTTKDYEQAHRKVIGSSARNCRL